MQRTARGQGKKYLSRTQNSRFISIKSFASECIQTVRAHSRVHQSLISLTLFVLLNNIIAVQAARNTPDFSGYVSHDPYQVADTYRLLKDYIPGSSVDPDQLAYTLEEKTSGSFLSNKTLLTTATSLADDSSDADQTAGTDSAPSQPPGQTSQYVVQIGDTLSQIAAKFNLKVATLQVKNNLDDADSIKPGEELDIPAADLPAQAIQAAADRKKASLALQQRQSQRSSGTNKSKLPGAGMIIPIRYKYIARGVGFGHDGIDYDADVGTPVHAAADGVVVIAASSGWNGGFGKTILITHPSLGNVISRYGHLSEVDVKPGEQVTQGEVIAKSGNTGNSTGPHLHFEVHVNGRVVDPNRLYK